MSEIFVVFAAIAVALVMMLKPEMFILNEAHRTPTMVKALRGIGMAVCIVLLAMFAANYMF